MSKYLFFKIGSDSFFVYFIKKYAFLFKALHMTLDILAKYNSIEGDIPINVIYGKLPEIQL